MECKKSLINPKILIVDDSPEIIQILGNILPKNIKRQVALNGLSALRLLKCSKTLPDLILLDVVMPGIDGYAICQQIKTDKRLKHIPIIFISSLSETFDKVRAFKVGGVDYITKPFQKDEVMARVKAHLTISNSRKEIQEIYSQTIQGTISAMGDMLAMSNPEASRISNIMRLYSELIMKELSITEVWDLKLACLLSGLGMCTVINNKSPGESFSNIGPICNLQDAYASLNVSTEIVERIPRFEVVTKILKNSMAPLASEYRNLPTNRIPSPVLKGHILRILIFYFYKLESEKNPIDIFRQMANSNKEFYSSEILHALCKVRDELINRDILYLKVDELQAQMILVEDLYSPDNRLMLRSGYELSKDMILLIKNLKELKDMEIKVMKKLGD